MALVLLLVSIISAVAGQLLLKQGMSRHKSFSLAELLILGRDPFIVGGFFCYGSSLLTYFKVLESLPLSFAYPTISLGYAFVVIMSRAIFKEPISSTRWLAVALICVGVVLVGIGAH
jgi:multidrug transporter EmrE-like cation transporter